MDGKGTSAIVGIENVCLKTKLGQKLVLKGVKYVPSLRYNLVSFRKLTDDG